MEFLKKVNQEIHPNIDIFNENQRDQLNFTYKSYLMNDTYWSATQVMNGLNETEKRKLSYHLEDLMIACSFNSNPCSAKDFEWYFDSVYGNCWMFNSGLNLNTSQNIPLLFSSFPGEEYGFQLSLYVNFYQNLASFNSYSIFSMLGGLGALIRIENKLNEKTL